MSPPVRFEVYDSVRQTIFESSNDRGYLLIASKAYTPAAKRLYFDNIIVQESSSAEVVLAPNRPIQSYELFLF